MDCYYCASAKTETGGATNEMLYNKNCVVCQDFLTAKNIYQLKHKQTKVIVLISFKTLENQLTSGKTL